MKTIHCMQSHIESLGQACRDQVLYLSEVQADIASNDRAYVADCSREVQLYCSDFTNLDQIYLCLSAHKDSQQFSKQVNRIKFIHLFVHTLVWLKCLIIFFIQRIFPHLIIVVHLCFMLFNSEVDFGVLTCGSE